MANAPHMPVPPGLDGIERPRRARPATRPWRPARRFALNNPYAGGTRLPDITVVMPIFMPGSAPGAGADFYVAARGHHADVGGVQPGSMPPFSHRIEEEGVMLDALPIMRGGRFLEAETHAALAAAAVAVARAGAQHRRPEGPDRRLPGGRRGGGGNDRGPWRAHRGPLHGLRAGQRGGLRPACSLRAGNRPGARTHGRRRRDRGRGAGGRRGRRGGAGLHRHEQPSARPPTSTPPPPSSTPRRSMSSAPWSTTTFRSTPGA